MRILPLSALALLLLAAPATAQEDACSQSEPCPWILDVDEDGVHGGGLNATVGDWYVIEAFNLDDAEHTLALEGHGVELTVPAVGEATSDPIHLDTPGTFALEDAPTGDFVWLEVRETDVVEDETGEDATPNDENTPLPLAVGLVALVGAALLRRR